MNQIITGLKHKIKSAVNGISGTQNYDAKYLETEVVYRFSLDIAAIKKRVNLYAVKVNENSTEQLIYYWFDGETCKYVRTLTQFTNKLNSEGWIHTN